MYFILLFRSKLQDVFLFRDGFLKKYDSTCFAASQIDVIIIFFPRENKYSHFHSVLFQADILDLMKNMKAVII